MKMYFNVDWGLRLSFLKNISSLDDGSREIGFLLEPDARSNMPCFIVSVVNDTFLKSLIFPVLLYQTVGDK